MKERLERIERPFKKTVRFAPKIEAVVFDDSIIIGAKKRSAKNQVMFVGREWGLPVGTLDHMEKLAQRNQQDEKRDFGVIIVYLYSENRPFYIGEDYKLTVKNDEPGVQMKDIYLYVEARDNFTVDRIDSRIDYAAELRKRRRSEYGNS
jgi:hypothetical protein